MYDLTIPEEELKNKVAQDFFGDFDTTERPSNIDFVVAPKRQHEQKKAIFSLGRGKKRQQKRHLCKHCAVDSNYWQSKIARFAYTALFRCI